MALTIDKIILICLIFLGSNVLGVFNIDEKLFHAMLLALAIIPCTYYSRIWKQNKPFLFLFLFVIIFAVYRLYTDRGEGTRASMLAILGAPILFSAFPDYLKYNRIKNVSFWRFVMTIVLLGYILETSLAIYERLIGYNVFGWRGDIVFSEEEMGEIFYRCTSLYGHPLGNALIITIAMSFILISKLKPKIKFLLWGLGYISILCFNTRGSIVGNALFLTIYLIYTITINKKMNSSTKYSIILGAIVSAIMGYIAIFYYGWGGRLLEMGLFDDSSAQVRVDAWILFDYYDIESFLFPHSYIEADIIKSSLGLRHLENPWLGIILYNGLFFLITYVSLYFMFFKRLFKTYSLFDKIFVSGAFLLIASTCNTFDTDFFGLFYFILLSVLFIPNLYGNIVDKKYLI